MTHLPSARVLGSDLGGRGGQCCCGVRGGGLGQGSGGGGRFPARAVQLPSSGLRLRLFPWRRLQFGPSRKREMSLHNRGTFGSFGLGPEKGFVLKCASQGQAGDAACVRGSGEPSPPGGTEALRARWMRGAGSSPRRGRTRSGQRVCDFAVSCRQEGGLERNRTGRHRGLRGSGPSTWPQRAVSPGAVWATSFSPQRDLCSQPRVEPGLPDLRVGGGLSRTTRPD